jgi:alkylation response protein AidB-like acyl-CoA dehydrogenase
MNTLYRGNAVPLRKLPQMNSQFPVATPDRAHSRTYTAASVAADRQSMLAAAHGLLPGIRARAARTEAERRIPRETIEELLAAGLFNVVTPRRFGGSELGFRTLVEISAALASACGSTGWVYGVLCGHAWMVSLFPAQAQAEVFDSSCALTASVFRMGGKTVCVPGGYQLHEGEGRFCSGVDFSGWVVVGSAIEQSDGSAIPSFLLVPCADIEIVDDWFTSGMRGTGSRSIRIADAFIPAHRAVSITDLAQGTSPGATLHHASAGYSAPFPVAQPFSLIGAPLGMARGALDLLCDSLEPRLVGMAPEQAGEQGALLARLARASADIDAAEALILRDAQMLDTAARPAELSAIQRAAIQRDFAFVAQSCRRAVSSLFEAAGGGGIYDSSALQRAWRDANAAAAHTAFNWDTAATAFGRARLGLPPSRFSGPRR